MAESRPKPKGAILTASTASMKVDLSKLPNPPESIYADEWAIVDRGLALELSFLRTSSTISDVIVLARVMIPIDSAVTHIWDSAKRFFDVEIGNLAKAKIELATIRTSAPAADVVVTGVNVMRISRAGVDSEIDCYYIPPQEVFRVGQQSSHTPRIEGVIRVQAPLTCLVSFLKYLSENEARFRSRIGPMLNLPGAAE